MDARRAFGEGLRLAVEALDRRAGTPRRSRFARLLRLGRGSHERRCHRLHLRRHVRQRRVGRGVGQRGRQLARLGRRRPGGGVDEAADRPGQAIGRLDDAVGEARDAAGGRLVQPRRRRCGALRHARRLLGLGGVEPRQALAGACVEGGAHLPRHLGRLILRALLLRACAVVDVVELGGEALARFRRDLADLAQHLAAAIGDLPGFVGGAGAEALAIFLGDLDPRLRVGFQPVVVQRAVERGRLAVSIGEDDCRSSGSGRRGLCGGGVADRLHRRRRVPIGEVDPLLLLERPLVEPARGLVVRRRRPRPGRLAPIGCGVVGGRSVRADPAARPRRLATDRLARGLRAGLQRRALRARLGADRLHRTAERAERLGRNVESGAEQVLHLLRGAADKGAGHALARCEPHRRLGIARRLIPVAEELDRQVLDRLQLGLAGTELADRRLRCGGGFGRFAAAACLAGGVAAVERRRRGRRRRAVATQGSDRLLHPCRRSRRRAGVRRRRGVRRLRHVRHRRGVRRVAAHLRLPVVVDGPGACCGRRAGGWGKLAGLARRKPCAGPAERLQPVLRRQFLQPVACRRRVRADAAGHQVAQRVGRHLGFGRLRRPGGIGIGRRRAQRPACDHPRPGLERVRQFVRH